MCIRDSYKVTGLKKEIFNLEFLTACANLAVSFSTLGCFEEACSDFAFVRTKHSIFRSAIAVAVIISVSEQHVVRVLRTHCQNSSVSDVLVDA